MAVKPLRMDLKSVLNLSVKNVKTKQNNKSHGNKATTPTKHFVF